MVHQDNDDLAPGEIRRAFERLEKQLGSMQEDVSKRYHSLADKMTVALGPIGELKVHVDNCRADINELGQAIRETKARTDKIELRAAAVAGGITTVALVIKFLLGK